VDTRRTAAADRRTIGNRFQLTAATGADLPRHEGGASDRQPAHGDRHSVNGVRDRNRSLENDPAPIREEVTVPTSHFAVEGLRTTTNPRLMPESESTVFMAFHNRLAGTHTAG
jgi:hypothetical protein